MLDKHDMQYLILSVYTKERNVEVIWTNRRLALDLDLGGANYYCLSLPEKNSFGDFEKFCLLLLLLVVAVFGFPENN